MPDFTDKQALPSGNVKALANQGQFLWFGSNSGIARLNTRTGKIERNIQVNEISGFSPVNTIIIVSDSMFVGTNKGVYLASLTDNIADMQVLQTFDETQAIRDLVVMDNIVLAATQLGLWALSPEHSPRQLALEDTSLFDLELTTETLWSISKDTLYPRILSRLTRIGV